MSDMSKFIEPKSAELTADDLLSGERVITITDAGVNPGAERPCRLDYEGSNGKPFFPCKTMGRVLVKAWGPDSSKYIGKSLLLYRDPEVLWAGMKVGGVRIKALSGIDKPFDMALTATRGKKAIQRFHPLKAETAKPKEDKAAKGAQALIARLIEAGPDGQSEILAEEKVIQQRAWMSANRRDLATLVDAAITTTETDDPFEGTE